MTRARVAWAIAGVEIMAVTIVMVIVPLIGPSSGPALGTAAGGMFFVLGIGAFSAVGALLIARVPGNLIGTLLLTVGTFMVAAILIGDYGVYGSLHDPPWPGSNAAKTIGEGLPIYAIFVGLIGIPLYFPNGRLPSPRFRWIARLTVALMVVWALESAHGVLLDNGVAVALPALITLVPVMDALEMFVFVATFLSFGSALVAVWLRFRRGDPVERQQVKWLVAVVAFGAVVWPVSFLLQDKNLADALSLVGIAGLFALPIVIGIAILRYRLYEIDRIISRTIGYAVVTGILAAVFAAMILVLQGMLTTFTQGQTIAVAASTLVVFALFQPVRHRIQGAVDRRFDRAKFDADLTIRGFSSRLRDDVDLDVVRGEITRTAGAAVRPTAAALWLRGEGS
jgi:hypothetical protein